MPPWPATVNFFAENWILIVVAFVSGSLLVWPLVKGGSGSGAVSTSEAVRLINRERGVLIDVAEPAEYAAGHASGARNVPFAQIPNGKDLPSNKALPLLVLCPTGGRARRAADMLRKAGYEKAVAVIGGTAAWRDAALPTEKAGDKPAEKAPEKSGKKGGGKTSGGPTGPAANKEATKEASKDAGQDAAQEATQNAAEPQLSTAGKSLPPP